MSRPRIRVAAYVIRYRSTPELLVFDHVGSPDAGTQVPAGGVGPDESLEQAVLREVAEETGLTEVSIIGPIAVDNRPRADDGQLRQTTFFQLTAHPDGADAWQHHVRGDGEDAGLEFACRFVPIPLAKRLADAQDAWLSCIDRRWGKAASSL
ncbi:NUDIX domain-containing protein [Streptosporangium sp. NPDC006013]|uniref:NUDIX hydrolase n=1 Tax=Streptosporangium sp. NPDC006013 TaxID=3155596 RepID=UPI00339EBE5E